MNGLPLSLSRPRPGSMPLVAIAGLLLVTLGAARGASAETHLARAATPPALRVPAADSALAAAALPYALAGPAAYAAWMEGSPAGDALLSEALRNAKRFRERAHSEREFGDLRRARENLRRFVSLGLIPPGSVPGDPELPDTTLMAAAFRDLATVWTLADAGGTRYRRRQASLCASVAKIPPQADLGAEGERLWGFGAGVTMPWSPRLAFSALGSWGTAQAGAAYTIHLVEADLSLRLRARPVGRLGPYAAGGVALFISRIVVEGSTDGGTRTTRATSMKGGPFAATGLSFLAPGWDWPAFVEVQYRRAKIDALGLVRGASGTNESEFDLSGARLVMGIGINR